MLHDLDRPIQRSRDLFQLVGLHLLQVFGNNLLRQGVLRIERFQLQQEALAKVAGADAERIELLDDR